MKKRKGYILGLALVVLVVILLVVILANKHQSSQGTNGSSSSTSQIKKESTAKKGATRTSESIVGGKADTSSSINNQETAPSQQNSSAVDPNPNDTENGQPITDDMIASARQQLIQAGYPANNYSDGDMKQLISRASAAKQTIVQYARENLPSN